MLIELEEKPAGGAFRLIVDGNEIGVAEMVSRQAVRG